MPRKKIPEALRRPRGRPKLLPHQKHARDATLEIRLSEQERAAVEKAAAADGLPPSTWGRKQLLMAARYSS